MGNSSGPLQLGQPSQISHSYKNNLYGNHDIVEIDGVKMARKTRQVKKQEEEQFLKFLYLYQKVSIPNLIKLLQVKPRGAEINQISSFDLYFQYYEDTLASINYARLGGWSQKQILRLINQVAKSLLLLKSNEFPYGVLCPSKVAVKKQLKGLQFAIAWDPLMNEEQYKSREVAQNEEVKKYQSPQQLKPANFPNYLTPQKTIVFSLGMVALQLIDGKSISRDKIEQQLFECRRKIKLQSCKLLEKMIKENNSERTVLREVVALSQKLLEDLDEDSREDNEAYYFRGYNIPEDDYLLTEIFVSEATRRRWKDLSGRS